MFDVTFDLAPRVEEEKLLYSVKLMCGRPKVFFLSVANFRKDEGENVCIVFFMGICVSFALSDTIVLHFRRTFPSKEGQRGFLLRERLPSFDSFHCTVNAVCGVRRVVLE